MMQPALGDEKERCITVTRADDTALSVGACSESAPPAGAAGSWGLGEEEHGAK